ncbi:MAG: hypothetical protein M3R59_03955 [Verrucomicrobiota bacterium]|nr:hypothetical protein [Verrucomicrobiota bacterium]
MDIGNHNLIAGWIGMLAGILSGALIGLFFHHEEWLGGYGSFRRRMTRLGHISFWGLGLLNMIFAFTTKAAELPTLLTQVASFSFLAGAVTMPLCCFLTAWRGKFRYFFPIPVGSLLLGVVCVLAGLAKA